MSLLKTVCSELGVNTWEKWTANDGKRYVIGSCGTLFECGEYGVCAYANPRSWEKILTGELKPVWRPKIGELFWAVQFENLYNVDQYPWSNAEWEKQLWEKGLVFQTKGKATEVANKMLEVIKE